VDASTPVDALTPVEAGDGPTAERQEDQFYAELLEGEPGPNHLPNEDQRQVVYLGETFNLTHLIRAANPKSPVALHRYTLAPSSTLPSATPPPVQDAYKLPPADVVLDLFAAYFAYFHPYYPVVHRTCFALRYQRLDQPPAHLLLLQSVLFAAAGHCKMDVIHRAGYQSRYDARLALFRRAKALYDADHETDKVTLVQSLFLMSFWWNKSTDQKDTWHWLGNAISLAVTIGMHRCTQGSALSAEDQKLWKRIWWFLYTEDKHAAAALGRPVHVRSSDCDIGPLEMTDLEETHESIVDSRVFGYVERSHMQYAVAICRLAGIVEKIIESSFCAYDRPRFDKLRALQGCGDELVEWKLRLGPDMGMASSLWAQVLEMAYK